MELQAQKLPLKLIYDKDPLQPSEKQGVTLEEIQTQKSTEIYCVLRRVLYSTGKKHDGNVTRHSELNYSNSGPQAF